MSIRAAATLRTPPHPPQLSSYDQRDQMWIQYAALRITIELENICCCFNTSGDNMADVETFYAKRPQVTEGSPTEAFVIGTDSGFCIKLPIGCQEGRSTLGASWL